jgi:hypothetical protein
MIVFAFSTLSTKADYVVIDWGDAVRLNVTITYKKPDEPVTQLHSVIFLYTYLGDSIPSHLKEQYPKMTITPPFSNAFQKNIIGMREGEKREFTISHSEVGDINASGEYAPLIGADISFRPVEFLEMINDANYDPMKEPDLITPTLLVLAMFLVVIAYILYKKGIVSVGEAFVLQKLKPHCAICGSPTNYSCGNQMCRKRLCQSCFSKEGGCPFCKHISLKSKDTPGT